MSDKKINCPFCGFLIEEDTKICPNCESLFCEPDLPNIKFKDFSLFMALTFLTGGIFSILWFLINSKSINDLVTTSKDKLKWNWLLILLIFDLAAFFLGYIKYSAAAITIAIMILLTYRTLRIIQKYSKAIYNVTPEINPYYVFIFNILYLVHFIDTYKERILEVHEYFNIKSPYMIALIVILIALQCNSILNPSVYNFYKWLFSPLIIN